MKTSGGGAPPPAASKHDSGTPKPSPSPSPSVSVVVVAVAVVPTVPPRASASDSTVTSRGGTPSAAERAAVISSRAYSAGQIPESAQPPTPSATPMNFYFFDNFLSFFLVRFSFFEKEKNLWIKKTLPLSLFHSSSSFLSPIVPETGEWNHASSPP